MERSKDKEVKDGYVEKLIKINRVTKVVKGGKNMSFSALVVVGYGDGRVGYGFGKANDVTDAIRKATEKAKSSLITVPLKGTTIPHEMLGQFKSASVLVRPAVPGTGVIAGGAVKSPEWSQIRANIELQRLLKQRNVAVNVGRQQLADRHIAVFQQVIDRL